MEPGARTEWLPGLHNGKMRLSLDAFKLFNKRASDIDYYYASRLPGEAQEGGATGIFIRWSPAPRA